MLKNNKRFTKMIGMLISVYVGVASASVHAMSCHDRSPNAQRGQDVYTPIPKNAIANNDAEQLFSVFNQAEGEWQGVGETTLCEKHNKKVETNTHEQTVKLKMKRASDTEYRVTFETFDVDRKLRKHYKFVIYRKDNFIDVKGEGNINIKRLSSTDVEFVTQSISVSFVGGGTQTQTREVSFESVRNMRVSGDRLSFEKSEYFNGEISSFSQWTFSK